MKKIQTMKYSKILSLFLVVTLVLLLASCGKSTEESGEKQENESFFSCLGADYDLELPVFALTRVTGSYGIEIIFSDFEIDDQGRIVKYMLHYDNVSSEVRWSYDNKGRASNDEEPYIYDKNNNIVTIGKKEFLYDDHGLMIESKFEGKTDDTLHYKLDNEGRVQSVEIRDEEIGVKSIYDFTYNNLNLPVSYTESKYGSGMNEDINTLSQIFDVKLAINPLGFLVRQENRRTFDSLQRDDDDYDVDSEYSVVGTYHLKSSNDRHFMPSENFIGFEEFPKLPKPDSVNSDITLIEKNGSEYKFRLGEFSHDPISIFNRFVHLFASQNRYPKITLPTESFCPESNNLFFAYAGVLKLLGYHLEISTDGQIDVTDSFGLPVATITKAVDDDAYVMNITFAESGIQSYG